MGVKEKEIMKVKYDPIIRLSKTKVKNNLLGYSIRLDGCATGSWGISAFLKRPRILVRLTEHNLISSNHWSSTEYNSNNSWNVNFSNGNFNNNNKYNGNVVRPVAASDLDEETRLGWLLAYEVCCANKKSSIQCSLYRSIYYKDLFRLAYEVENRIYVPSVSQCFVVTKPKLREIFAANFRDRIVQHWIVNRIEPLLEKRFVSQGNVSFNCRKGFGTLSAVNSLRKDFEEVSNMYTKETFVGKFDMSSFFMSIDTEVLLKLFIPFIRQNYEGPDVETLIWVTETTVRSRPQDNCVKRGRFWLWDELPPNKSLFNNPIGIGMPIGNITSQLLANFYLSFLDEYMIGLCSKYGARYRRFVDDFVIVCNSKSAIKVMRHKATWFLKEKLHIKLHPDKIYIQDIKKGVKFVGSVIKPGRIYLSNRTVGGFHRTLIKLENLCNRILHKIDNSNLTELEHYICSINSYMGFLIHCSSYNILSKAFSTVESFYEICNISDDLHIINVIEEYKLINYLNKQYALSRKKSSRVRHVRS